MICWIGCNIVVGVGVVVFVWIVVGMLENWFDCFVLFNYCVLVCGFVFELLFGEEEVLVIVKYLIDGMIIM